MRDGRKDEKKRWNSSTNDWQFAHTSSTAIFRPKPYTRTHTNQFARPKPVRPLCTKWTRWISFIGISVRLSVHQNWKKKNLIFLFSLWLQFDWISIEIPSFRANHWQVTVNAPVDIWAIWRFVFRVLTRFRPIYGIGEANSLHACDGVVLSTLNYERVCLFSKELRTDYRQLALLIEK